jgi:hypothetical protein
MSDCCKISLKFACEKGRKLTNNFSQNKTGD